MSNMRNRVKDILSKITGLDWIRNEAGDVVISGVDVIDECQAYFTAPDTCDPDEADSLYRVNVETGQLDLMIGNSHGRRWMSLIKGKELV